MNRTATTNTVRLLLISTAMMALAIGLAFASPASAQFVDEGTSDDADAAAEDHEGTTSNDGGFVGEDDEAAPIGGVDAGHGGGAIDPGAGLGAPHALALALLLLAVAGHVALVRRVSPARA